jgi:hypothetical protein
VHTSDELRSVDFDITIGVQQAAFAEVFPNFTEHDRLGVVVRSPFGATGASTLILAAITAFYDVQRAKQLDYFLYPDYFLLHVGADHGDHNMLDIYPDHKEIVVADQAEHLLQAINDRAITRLLVPDGTLTKPMLQAETVGGAKRRLLSALAYSSTGRTENSDVTVAGSATTEGYVLRPELTESLAAGAEQLMRARPAAEITETLLKTRTTLLTGHRPVETFRRISIDEALQLLEPRES